MQLKTERCIAPISPLFEGGPGDAPTLFNLGIDVRTKDARKLRGRLAKLKPTLEVSDGGAYQEDPNYSIVNLDTTLTEDEVDAWLYAGRGIGYVGVFVRRGIDFEIACPQYGAIGEAWQPHQ